MARNLEGLLNAIDDAYGRPDIIPAPDVFVEKREGGTLACCGLGAAWLNATHGEPRLAHYTTVWAWAADAYGVSRSFCHGFQSGFDNQGSELCRYEEFKEGYEAGKLMRLKWLRLRQNEKEAA